MSAAVSKTSRSNGQSPGLQLLQAPARPAGDPSDTPALQYANKTCDEACSPLHIFRLLRKTSRSKNRVQTISSLKDFSESLRDFIREGVTTETHFDELALSLFALQFSEVAPYRRLCDARKVSPPTVRHWSEIPALPTSAFKELEISSLQPDERTHVFHSSGTTEQIPSRHFHNADSLTVYEASLLPWFEKHFLADWDELGRRTRSLVRWTSRAVFS